MGDVLGFMRQSNDRCLPQGVVVTAPLLSFCMPTYNYGRYIRTALESIRIQTEVGVEVGRCAVAGDLGGAR